MFKDGRKSVRYEGTVYRPPSEANSLILQVTIGCSHNKCTFCNMYKNKKFKIREIENILEDLKSARNYYSRVKKVFLADGNALVMKTEDIKEILLTISEIFSECERVGIYAAPKDILRKTLSELSEFKKLGLGIIYLGLESGSDEILKTIKKGAVAQDMISAASIVKESGIKLSITLISGIGGLERWQEHAAASAEVINKMDPDYLGLLTLIVEPNTEIYEEVASGRFKLLSPKEIMLETTKLIENLELSNCVFRSNHASNYVALAGVLPFDKQKLLSALEKATEEDYGYRDDFLRRL